MTTIRAGVLDVGYERHGPTGGWPVVLLHGFPYDVRCYDEVVAPLTAAGADVVVPYLRGYGPTRFLDDATMRSGQQAALAADLLALLDAFGFDRATVAGYDWGGRAACLTALLHPERVAGLVSVGGYNVQRIARAQQPHEPVVEHRLWYQRYLHDERGREGLRRHRAAFARLLWEQWSPGWAFTDAQFAATAPSFDNPDFVDVVTHSYRHRYGIVPGDPAYQDDEERIARQPPVEVPTIVLEPTRDGVADADDANVHAARFPRLLDVRYLACGHDVPQEEPAAFAQAVLDLPR